jgi:hypothetical protein
MDHIASWGASVLVMWSQTIVSTENISSGDDMSGEEGGDGSGSGNGSGAEEKEDPEEDPFYRQERLKAEAKKQKAKEQKKRQLEGWRLPFPMSAVL